MKLNLHLSDIVGFLDEDRVHKDSQTIGTQLDVSIPLQDCSRRSTGILWHQA